MKILITFFALVTLGSTTLAVQKRVPFTCQPSPLLKLPAPHGKTVPVQFTFAQPANVLHPYYLESHTDNNFYRQYFIKTGNEQPGRYGSDFILPTSTEYGPLYGFFGPGLGPIGSVVMYNQNGEQYFVRLLGTVTCNGRDYWVLDDDVQ